MLKNCTLDKQTSTEGDWEYVRIMKQQLRQVGKKCPKLSFRMYGPFSVIKKINDISHAIAFATLLDYT